VRILVLAITLLAAGCPDDDTTDYAWTCPKRTSDQLFTVGPKLGSGYTTVNNMLPGSTQILTVLGEGSATTTTRFDAGFIGERGMSLSRITANQFLISADEDANGCLEVAIPDSNEAATYPIYAGHPYRVVVEPETPAYGLRGSDLVYLRRAHATVELWNGGGYQYVDAQMRIASSDQIQQIAWDTIEVDAQPGVVPLEVFTSDGATHELSIEVVAKPDRVALTYPIEVPELLPVGKTTDLCFDATYQGRQIVGLEWTFAVANANWTAGLVPFCLAVTPTVAGQTVSVSADASGATTQMTFTTN
jgi:hypothetical protein